MERQPVGIVKFFISGVSEGKAIVCNGVVGVVVVYERGHDPLVRLKVVMGRVCLLLSSWTDLPSLPYANCQYIPDREAKYNSRPE